MKVKRAYKYRFYATTDQEIQFSKTFGCARFIYNWGLDLRSKAYKEGQKNLYYKDTAKLLTELKKTEGYTWLNEVSNVVLQQALRHLDSAFKNFFLGIGKYPRFKSKRESQAASYTDFAFTVREKSLTLAKQKEPLDIRWSRDLPKGTRVSSVTVTRTATGKYFISLLVEEEITALPLATREAGIDLNSGKITLPGKELCLLDTGKEEHKLKRLQKVCARKIEVAKKKAGITGAIPKGVRLPALGNMKKARMKVAVKYERIANIRNDWRHKATTAVVHENQVVAVEGLYVKGMTASARGTKEDPGKMVKQKAGLNRSILATGFGEIARLLAYKCRWYGRDFVAINPFFPSSKMCSACGHQLKEHPLSTRTWMCPACGTVHDRDRNAAINILNEGKAVLNGTSTRGQFGEFRSVERAPAAERRAFRSTSRHAKKQKTRTAMSLESHPL